MSIDKESPAGRTALAFARALVSADFDAAANLLSNSLRVSTSPSELRDEYNSMVEYGDGPADNIELMEELEDWPGKEANDIGWAYVAISGETFGEAVAVVVTVEDGVNVIREIEWGRP